MTASVVDVETIYAAAPDSPGSFSARLVQPVIHHHARFEAALLKKTDRRWLLEAPVSGEPPGLPLRRESPPPVFVAECMASALRRLVPLAAPDRKAEGGGCHERRGTHSAYRVGSLGEGLLALP
ncbi:hypothetical protein HIM_05762 [Hirsutella minnesotensis 3608]|uniref:Uncharacterized protein n=1 Tax=Hirsutella minnesotensis 3608 TaxID=1043627 RepID=A0A0F7ZUH1_9HYPO|nr:hypothetical protein HIM_05762 [Hirsutella minnesotensis 3608]